MRDLTCSQCIHVRVPIRSLITSPSTLSIGQSQREEELSSCGQRSRPRLASSLLSAPHHATASSSRWLLALPQATDRRMQGEPREVIFLRSAQSGRVEEAWGQRSDKKETLYCALFLPAGTPEEEVTQAHMNPSQWVSLPRQLLFKNYFWSKTLSKKGNRYFNWSILLISIKNCSTRFEIILCSSLKRYILLKCLFITSPNYPWCGNGILQGKPFLLDSFSWDRLSCRFKLFESCQHLQLQNILE